MINKKLAAPDAEYHGRQSEMMLDKRISHKQYNVNPPPFISALEAAELYRFMITQEIPKKDFLDERNNIIYRTLENIYQKAGSSFMGVTCLLNDLTESRLLEAAGGEDYVRGIFGDHEPDGFLNDIISSTFNFAPYNGMTASTGRGFYE